MQNPGLIDFQDDFFLGIALKISRMSISNFISFTLIIINLEMVLR